MSRFFFAQTDGAELTADLPSSIADTSAAVTQEAADSFVGQFAQRDIKRRSPTQTHGMSRTPTHVSWTTMRRRCNNPAFFLYARYGGRGIRVCERWNSFELFLADMGERPAGYTLDRIDNDGNYEPGNCRWASKKEQQSNTSKNHKEEAFGEVKTIAQWAADPRCAVSARNLSNRLSLGWPVERALSEPLCALQSLRSKGRHTTKEAL